MQPQNKVKIFLVDDDALLLKSLEIEFLELADFDVETYATGELCVENLANKPDIIILDYHLDGIDKLEKIKEFNPEISVIMLSSQDKIEVAVNCMHHKAADYVVKSETAFIRLQKKIATILSIKKMEKELSWYMDRV